MLATVKGYYDGTQIVMDEEERKYFANGDEVIITILDKASTTTRRKDRKQIIDSGECVIPTGRTVQEIDNYLRGLREDDRF